MFIKKSTTRGQTLPDYAIAFGLFMLAILIAFNATTVLFSPYNTGQEKIGESNRLANHLIHTTLISDQTQQYVLDPECTVSSFKAFKGMSTTLYDKCHYTNTIDDMSYRKYLGMIEGRYTRIAIVNENGSAITYDGVKLSFGKPVPDTAQTANSYRMVRLNGDIYKLRVTTW